MSPVDRKRTAEKVPFHQGLGSLEGHIMGTQSVLVLWPSLFSQVTVLWSPPSCTSTSWFTGLPPCSYNASPLRRSFSLVSSIEGQRSGSESRGHLPRLPGALVLESRIRPGTNYEQQN